MFRSKRLRQRLVINIDTAERMGVVSDIEIDDISGRITRVIVRRHGIFSWLLHTGEFMIPWESIKAASNEFMLVKMFDLTT